MPAAPPISRSGNSRPTSSRTPRALVDLTKYMEKEIQVKFAGGKEIHGILKGWDPLLNLVVDVCILVGIKGTETIRYIRVGNEQCTTTYYLQKPRMYACKSRSIQ